MTDPVFADYSDKSIAAVRDEVGFMEMEIANLLKMFTDEFGVVVERIDIEGAPEIWNQQGERVRKSHYMVKLKTIL